MSKWQQNGKEAGPILALVFIAALAIGTMAAFSNLAIHEVLARFPYHLP